MMPRNYIEEIKTRLTQSDEDVLDSLAGAIDRLQKAFPRRGHFLMEFIQNADDAESNSLKIEVNKNVIRILNDGRPFQRKDVESICKVGRSSKIPEDYIGYLGVGFKSVFLVSECPQIYSGGYTFKFDKNHWPNPKNVPWQIIPIWVGEDGVQSSLKEQYKTMFTLPISIGDEKLISKIEEETTPEQLSNRILIFLRHLREIEIHNQNLGLKRKIIKSKNISTSQDYEKYVLEEYEDDELKKSDRWLVFRSECKVPEDVKEDWLTKDWERESVTKREVLVSFKLDEEDALLEEERGTAHIGVFSYLPLKEDTPSGLKFLIQADFLTVPGRGSIPRDKILWNEWLSKEILNLITKKCIPQLLKHEKWKMNFTKILYPAEWGHPLFDDQIKSPLKNYLENNPVLVGVDDILISPREAVSIGSEIRDLLTEDDFQIIYPDKKILHPNCQSEMQIKEIPSNVYTFITSSQGRNLISQKAESTDILWFKKLYEKLGSGYNLDGLKYENIILTEKKDVTNSRDVYIKSENLSIPPEIESNFKIVHSNLAADTNILRFLKNLGVEELTKEHIENNILKTEIPLISKNWPFYSEDERINKTKLCKELWKKNQIETKDLNFLTLISKGGEWLKPADLVFSKEYKPEHKIEELTEKGLLKSEDLQRLNIKFLSTDYIAEDDKEIKNWYDFFKELNLEGNLDKEKVTQRIGINTALCFEREKGRTARELTRSEELGGYDIESNSGERLIEVKGRADPSPQIWLTPTQHKKLQKEGERYFLYVIRDALRNPILSEIKGSKLLEVDYSISIDFYRWKNLSEEEFECVVPN